MGWIIFYTVLLISYVGGWAYSLYHPNHIPDIISKISGLVALLSAMGMALQKSSLRAYFFFQRIAIRFFPDTTSRWWFSARYDGHFPDDSVRLLIQHFQSKDFRFPVKVEREDNLTAQIDVDDTLVLSIQLDPQNVSEDQLDHITVLSKVMEVSHGHAKRKLDTQIVPVGYIGMEDRTLDPIIRPGSFVQIDSRERTIPPLNWHDDFDRPIFFFELRDRYICSWCELYGTD
jgi:hypothetical protein